MGRHSDGRSVADCLEPKHSTPICGTGATTLLVDAHNGNIGPNIWLLHSGAERSIARNGQRKQFLLTWYGGRSVRNRILGYDIRCISDRAADDP